ncbi:MAG: VCBS repeat-containing protein, partial [Planctomycetales bacterium]|nr:VCBS repeat-containing protein [Planctomycetales bacterium]
MAFIANDAMINQDNTTPAHPEQSVNVSSANDSKAFGLSINLVQGAISVGAGIDIGVFDNDTLSTAAPGATINARQDIDFHALTRIEGDSFVGALGDPDGFGLQVTASLYSIRGDFQDTKVYGVIPLPLSELNALNGDKLQEQLDTIIFGLTQDLGGGLQELLGDLGETVRAATSIGTAIATAAPQSNAITGAVTGDSLESRGTLVEVTGATLVAGRDVSLLADEETDLALDTTWTFAQIPGDDSPLFSLANNRSVSSTRSMSQAIVRGQANIQAGRDVTIHGTATNDDLLTSSTTFSGFQNKVGALVVGSTVNAGRDVDMDASNDASSAAWTILPTFGLLGTMTADAYHEHDVQAKIINQDDMASQVNATGSIHVVARDDSNIIAVADAVAINKDGKALAIGMSTNRVQNTIAASIENSQAHAIAGNIDVHANSSPDITAIALGGAIGGGGSAAAGSVSNNTIASTIDAHISGTSDVDAAGTISVDAFDGGTLVATSGDVTVANGRFGAGAALSFNTITSTVKAYIEGGDAADKTANIDAVAVDVLARTNIDIDAISVGGQFAQDFVLGGSVSTNEIGGMLDAHISRAAKVNATNQTRVQTNDDTHILAISGNAAIATANSSHAIGAAVSTNDITRTAIAKVDGAETDITSGTVDIASLTNADIQAIAVGGQFATGSTFGASVSTNKIGGSLESIVSGDAHVSAAATVRVRSADDATLVVLTGLAGFTTGTGGAAFGAAISKNEISRTVRATVLGSDTLISGASVDVIASTDADITATSVGGTGASEFALGGSVSINTLINTVEARVAGGASITATGGGVKVAADDDANINAITGAGAGSTGAGAIGAAFSTNDIQSTVTANVTGTNTTVSAGAVEVRASTDGDLTVIAAGGAGADSFALGGSGSINKLHNTLTASVSSSAVVSGTSNAIVKAEDDSRINSFAGAGAGAISASIGITFSTNELSSTVTAIVDDAHVSAPNAQVLAVSTNDILAIAGAGSGASSVTGSGAVTLNDLADIVEARVTGTDAVVNGSNVDVSASVGGTINAIAGVGTGAGSGAIAGSVADNAMSMQVRAIVAAGARVEGTASVDVTADDTSIIRVFAGAGSGAGTFAAGAAVGNNQLNNALEALVVDGSTRAIGGSVTVSANCEADIASLTAVGAGAGTIAGDASISLNDLGNQVTARIGNGAIASGSAIVVEAHDDSTIAALTGAGAGAGTAAIAAAFGTNSIHTETIASVASATVNSQSLSVFATSDADIEVVAVSGSGAGTFSFGGSISLNDIATKTTASILTGTHITTTGATTVRADDKAVIRNIAGAGSGAGAASGGVVVGTNDIANETRATVSDSGTIITSATLTVQANSAGEILAITAVGSGAGTAAGAVSVSTNDISSTTEASIAAAAQVTATGLVAIVATDDALIRAISGAGAGAGGAAIAGAVSLNDLSGTTRAIVDGNNTRVQAGSLQVQAGATAGTLPVTPPPPSSPPNPQGRIEALAIGGSGAGTAAVAGSDADNEIANTVEAVVRNGANVQITGNAQVTARDDSTIFAIAGGGSGAGGVAGGAALSDNDIKNTIRAVIDNADVASTAGSVIVSASSDAAMDVITASGAGAGVFAAAGSLAFNSIANVIEASIVNSADVSAANNVSITATDTSSISSLAGTATGAGIVAAGGAFAKNDVANQVRAAIRGAATEVTATAGSIALSALEDADLETAAFGVGGAGFVSVTGGVARNEIDNVVEATITNGATVTARGNVDLTANDTSHIKSLSGQAGGAFAAGIGGAASYNEIGNIVRASIDGADVTSQNDSITVDARSASTIETIAAGGNGAIVGISGSVAMNVMANTVEAFVRNADIIADDNIVVLADANNTVDTWGGTIGGGIVGLGGTVVTNMLDNVTRAFAVDSNVVARGVGTGATVPQWNADTGVRSNGTVRGFSVIATSTEAVDVRSVTGVIGGVGIAGNISVTNVEDTTEAFIVSGSVNSSSDFGQSVVVRAHQDTAVDVKAGALSAGGVALAAADDTTLINNHTQSFISDTLADSFLVASDASTPDPQIFARGVEVSSRTRETVDVVLGGASVGSIAVAGSISVTNIDSDNNAYLRHANISSLGDILVNADNIAKVDTTVGAVAGSISVSAGGSVTVNTISNTTRARIIGGNLNATGAIDVLADTDETIDTTAVTGAVGLGAGLAGAVSVNTIETTTEALIEPGSPTRLNQDAAFRPGGAFAPGAAQQVSVIADNNAKVTGLGGGLGAGLAGIGAAIDVGAIRNRTVANVGNEADVFAVGNINVLADSRQVLDSKTGAFGAGLFGLSGAISVLSLGAPISSDGAAEFKPGLVTDVNRDIRIDAVPVNTQDDSNRTAAEVQQRLAALPDPSVNDSLNASANTSNKVTSAFVSDSGNAATGARLVSANGNITISADRSYDVDIHAGDIAVGLVGFGASIGIVNVDHTTQAFLGRNGQLEAGGNIDISANDHQTSGNSSIGIFTGKAGFIAVGGGIASFDMNTDVDAFVNDDATIVDGAAVSINANQQASPKLDVFGLNIGLVAAGAAVTVADVNADVNAFVDNGATIGSTSDRVGSLSILAEANNLADLDARASSVGLVAGEAAVSNADIDADSQARIGNADIFTNGNVTVRSRTRDRSFADANGAAGGLAAGGASIADATVTGDVTSRVDTGATIVAGTDVSAGDLTVIAETSNETSAVADSTAIGLIAGLASVPDATINVNVNSLIGDADIDASDDVFVDANSFGKSFAAADGDAIGAIGVGGSVGDATVRGLTQAHVDSGAVINAGTNARQGDVRVRARTFDHVTNTNATNLSEVDADATGIGLVGGAGAVADTVLDVDYKAFVGNSQITAMLGNIAVEADARNKTRASADGKAAGIAAVGIVDATSDMRTLETLAFTSSGAVLIAGRNVDIEATSNHVADVDAIGGQGGLIAVGAATTQTDLTTRTRAEVGASSNITAGDTFSLIALNTINVNSNGSEHTPATFGGENDTESVSNVDSLTEAIVGAGAVISASQVVVQARDVNVLVESIAEADTSLAGESFNDALADVHATVRSNVSVNSGAQITANGAGMVPGRVSLEALQDLVKTRTRAIAKANGLLGSTTATSKNVKVATANVTVSSGAKITAAELFTEAFADKDNPDNYVEEAETDQHTLAGAVIEAVEGAATVVGELVCLWGLVCDAEGAIDAASDAVRGFTGNGDTVLTTSALGLPAAIVDSTVNFNGNVMIMGGISPEIEIDAAGRLVRADGKGIVVRDGNGNPIPVGQLIPTNDIIIDDIRNTNPPGLIHLEAEGRLSGDSDFTFNTAFDEVNIINNSAKNLRINDIEVLNQNATTPSIVLIGVPAPKDTFHYDLFTNAIDTFIDIQNTSTADRDILLLGHIENQGGITSILNRGGDILANDQSGFATTTTYIRTRDLRLTAELGSVGRENPNGHERIFARMVATEIAATPRIEAHGNQGVYVDATLGTGDANVPLTLNTDNLTSASGDVDFRFSGGYRLVPQIDSSSFPPKISTQIVFQDVTLNMGAASAGGDILLVALAPVDKGSGNILADTNWVLNGTILAANGQATVATMSGDLVRGTNSHVVAARDVALAADVTVDTSNRIVLSGSTTGRIGTVSKPIRTNLLGGKLDAKAGNDIVIYEAQGAILTGEIESLAGGILLRTPDLVSSGQNILVPNGSTITTDEGDIRLFAGDDITIEAGAEVNAGDDLHIRGDFGNADLGVPTTINVHGSLFADYAEIAAERDNDLINVSSVPAGAVTQILGNEGQDTMNLDIPVTDAALVVAYGDYPITTAPLPPDADVIDAVDSTLGLFIDGGGGFDIIDGGQGPDTITGSSFHDIVRGGPDNDTLYGDAAFLINFARHTVQAVESGYANIGIPGADNLFGEDGDDTIHGNGGDDKIFGELGDDTAFGDAGRDFILGDIGNDTLHGGSGGDFVSGGIDTGKRISLDALNRDEFGDYVDGDAGHDLVVGGKPVGYLQLELLVAHDFRDLFDDRSPNPMLFETNGQPITDTDFISLLNTLTTQGDDGSDIVHGGHDNDLLTGDEGADNLYGDWGNDVILAYRIGSIDSPEDDRLEGGPDNDNPMCGSLGQNVMIGGTSDQNTDYILNSPGRPAFSPYAGGYTLPACVIDDPVILPTLPVEITGRKFEDINGNSLYDVGEPGLNGWIIELRDDEGHLIATTETTDLDLDGDGAIEPETETGWYSFRDTSVGGNVLHLDAGSYIVVEQLQSGYRQTVPMLGDSLTLDSGKIATTVPIAIVGGPSAIGYLVGLDSGTQPEDVETARLDFANSRSSAVSGFKFHDLNANGLYEPDEPPLANWTIVLTDANGLVSTQVTNADGKYRFTGLPAGSYTVAEQPQAGWSQTAPATGSYALDVPYAEVLEENNFGNVELAAIRGTKWHDLNGDGIFDVNEITGGVIGPILSPFIDLNFNGIREINEILGILAPNDIARWNDVDGDNIQDRGEPGLAGFVIYLDDNNNGLLDAGERSTTTDINGDYQFDNVIPGDYIIREILPAGWQQSVPGSDDSFGLSVHLNSGEVKQDVDFGNYRPATIRGIKWLDEDGDGKFDLLSPPFESGAANWTIFLDTNGNGILDDGEQRTTTDATGFYRFDDLPPGRYTVAEIIDGDFTQTFPRDRRFGETQSFDLVSDESRQVNFGNSQAFRVEGTKWHDLNGNGIRDAGEPGLAGWKVFVDLNGNSGFDVGEPSAITRSDDPATSENEEGTYTLADVPAGTFSVIEVLPTLGDQLSNDTNALRRDWTQTFPGTPGSPLPQVITLSDESLTGVDFGNVMTGEISGLKWQDLNGNGQFDYGVPVGTGDEPGLPDWVIYLDLNNNGILDRIPFFQIPLEPFRLTNHDDPLTTNNEAGTFSFNNLLPGTYVVREELVNGWEQTVPGSSSGFAYTIELKSGDIVQNIGFANGQDIGSISGTKWEDIDGDGKRGTQEPGLSGWTIFLDANGDGERNANELSTQTDVNGRYSFTGLTAGTYRVVELPQVGWHQTSPQSPWTVELSTNGAVASIDFGNQRDAGEIHGVKWLDMDRDGKQDGGEMGLPGWTVYLDLNRNGILDRDPATREALEPSTVTMLDDPATSVDEAGMYWFANLPPGDYLVAEVQQTGWVQTYPSENSGRHVVTVTTETVVNVDFGNNLYGDCNGTGTVDAADIAAFQNAFNSVAADPRYDACFDSEPDGDIDFRDLYVFQQQLSAVGGVAAVSDTANYFSSQAPTASYPTQHAGITSNSIQPTALTPGNAQITGTKFNDLDGDGQRDENEPGIAGIIIYIDENNNGVRDTGRIGELFTTTDTNGNYVLSGIGTGEYLIREELPSGSQQTFPNLWATDSSNILHNLSFDTGAVSQIRTLTVNSDARMAGLTVSPFDGRLYGMQTNGAVYTIDTVRGTAALQATLAVDSTDDVFPFMSPGEGDFDFDPTSFSGPGDQSVDLYVVSGRDTQFLPNTLYRVTVTYDRCDQGMVGPLTCSPTFSRATFISRLDVRDASGMAFTDSGDLYIYDRVTNGEPGSVGRVIQIDKKSGQQLRSITVPLFDFFNNEAGIDFEPGTSLLYGVHAGNTLDTYFTFDVATGVLNTTAQKATNISGLEFFDAHRLVVKDGEFVRGADFGNQPQFGSISGVKWNDIDGDGKRSDFEPVLAGWTVYLDLNLNGQFDDNEPTRVTNENGRYQFALLPAGFYQVGEIIQSGWLQTFPADRLQVPFHHTVSLSGGSNIGNANFGNIQLSGEISGTKWEDLNGNLERDEGERGVPGFTIFLDQNENLRFDAGEPSTITDENGDYSFVGLPPGFYVVVEVQQPGWRQTFPFPIEGPGAYFIELGPGGTASGIDFGNQPLLGEIHGTKFEDIDGDGQRDFDEPGIPGVRIYIDVNNDGILNVDANGRPTEPVTTTMFDNPDTRIDETGMYWFVDLPGGRYIVREVVPEGQFATGPEFSFAGPRFYEAGDASTDLVAADINGDGTPELVVLDTDGIHVLPNTGNGHFGAPDFYAAGDDPSALAAGDLNGDGLADIVVATTIPETIAVFFGRVDGSLSPPVSYPASSSVGDLVVADLTGDGSLDVAWTDTSKNQIVIMSNSQSSELVSFATIGTTEAPAGLTAADLDLDGDLELVTVGLELSEVQVFTNDGTGSFELAAAYRLPGQGEWVTAADFNQDGNLDLAVSNPGRISVSLLINTGSVFGIKFAPAVDLLGFEFPNQLATGDINDDDLPELFVAESGFSSQPIFYGDIADPLAARTQLNTGHPSQTVVTADFDGDGLLDVAYGGSFFGDDFFFNGVSVFLRGVRDGHTVDLEPGDVVEDRDFANIKPGEIQGEKFLDLDCDGVRNFDQEFGLEGVTIYVDLNNNAELDADEPFGVTNENGFYRIVNVPPGTHRVREVVPDGFFPSFPELGFHEVTITRSRQIVDGIDFGNFQKTVLPDGDDWLFGQDNSDTIYGDNLTEN